LTERHSSRRRALPVVATLTGVALACAAIPAQAATAAAPLPSDRTHTGFRISPEQQRAWNAATTSEQRARVAASVVPQLPYLVSAYNVKKLWAKGIAGNGISVATVVSFGDPTIVKDIHAYDKSNGLPDPSLKIIQPSGKVPSCKKDGCGTWPLEALLDVMMIHTMAPKARVVVAETPVDETQGITGLPQMMHAIDYMADHKLANVISMSFGTAEQDFTGGAKQIRSLDPAFDHAQRAHITLTASTGDSGATNAERDGNTLFPYRTASWPATDPRVTALGGTIITVNNKTQKRTTPDVLWPESGGGVSKVYARPSWQLGVDKHTGAKARSLPDITMEGIQGTSESSPLFAGIVALADQYAHRSLGMINPALYKIGSAGARIGLQDVTKGDNGVDSPKVTGYRAGKGFDIVSGWGTVNDATKFVPALVQAATHP
jgi:subtilase family serine protease